MKHNFLIGDFCFSLEYPEEITPPPNLMKFKTEEKDPEYAYVIDQSVRFFGVAAHVFRHTIKTSSLQQC